MNKITCILLLTLLALGCRRDELIDRVIVEENPPKILVVSSFRGKVLDESGAPVPGAKVSIYKTSAWTDSQGAFVFDNIEAPKGAALVKVEKQGYFTGSATAGSVAKGKQYVRVTMLEKGTSRQVSAGQGGLCSWPDGSKVTIRPNTVARANGSPYQGPVNVFARWVDPSAPNLGAVMPGALTALDADRNERVLSTFGMMTFVLETPAGEPLALKQDESADLEIPIPGPLQADAPLEIPVWYFDLEEERWLINGYCQKKVGTYIMGASKTGFWNCDIPLEAICLSGTVFQSDSTPAFYTKVIVEDLTDNFIYWGYTDINGFFCGSVPKGAPLRISIEDLCGNVIYSAEIGPYATYFDLGEIWLSANLQQYLIRVFGQLTGCDGQGVSLGQIAVEYPKKIRLFPTNPDGSFDFNLALNCTMFPELRITGYRLGAQFAATPVQNFTDLTEIDLGIMSACAPAPDSFWLAYGTDTLTASPTRFFKITNVTTNWMVLEALTVGGSIVLDLREYQGVGTYLTNAIFNVKNLPAQPLYPVLNSASPAMSVVVSEDNGQHISGTLSGTSYDVFGQPVPVNGQFKIKRQH